MTTSSALPTENLLIEPNYLSIHSKYSKREKSPIIKDFVKTAQTKKKKDNILFKQEQLYQLKFIKMIELSYKVGHKTNSEWKDWQNNKLLIKTEKK